MEGNLNALIVDDEESARKLLDKLLEETLKFREIRSVSSVDSAINELARFEPDLIFLDIKMPGKDGFSIFDNLTSKKNKPGIVFVTAFDQYALKAIKNEAFDYLLKPLNRKELKKCVEKFSERKKEFHDADPEEKPFSYLEKIPRIKVNARNGTLFINPSSVLFCKAEGNYTSVCTGDKKHLCSMNMGKIEALLNGNGFIRIGRSYIINFEYITLLDRKESKVTLTRGNESVTIKLPRQHLKEIDKL